ncbi:tagaturonate reductase [Algoriphagus marincola]|uniref:Tagaturonate reductase n=1 Tax=Algoriphagus marincola TaxID=264027 RepID=A0ABS7N8J5_9BACT|nr:tagaturonate reductase [Algoriphagus marincola]MBY5952650.1 tagaturonate reductase [Algoriphagus marincola]
MSKQEPPIRILQVGNGNFLRGFLDWMIQKANEKGVWEGGIHSIQIHSTEIDQRMVQQANQFHVWTAGIEKGKKINLIDKIDCVKRYTCLTSDFSELKQISQYPSLEWVISNTTEAGIKYEKEVFQAGTIPKTFPAKMTALLWERFQYFGGDPEKGLTFLPCELIANNGGQLQEIILQYARDWSLEEAFTDWIKKSCKFCNTLVDRIVPGFPKDKINELSERLTTKDKLLVMAEPYHFWAIEGDEQVEKSLPLHRAGLNVQFVADIKPFRERKVRILNGAHSALVPYAYLQGLRTVRESVEDPKIGKWLRELVFEEIVPHVPLDQEETLLFAEAVMERFANPFIQHELKSIALNQISKFKVRVLPSLLDYFKEKEQWPQRLMESFAATLLFYNGQVGDQKIPLNDDPEILTLFEELWKNNSEKELVQKVISEEKLWGENLSLYQGLSESLENALEKLQTDLGLL